MDLTKAEKFLAMKKCRKNQVFNYTDVILHLLAGIACSLLFSYAFWFPYCVYSSMKHFFVISLPCIWSCFFNPKCLFIVVNIIVIFLVGESRLVGTSSSSPARDIYNEYIDRSRSLRGGSPVISTTQENIIRQEIKRMQEVEKEAEVKEEVNVAEEKEVKEEEDGELVEDQVKEVMKLAETEEKEVNIAEEATQVKQEETVVQGTSEIVEEEEEKERDIVEEEAELPTDELNKRVEEFIARVNKQRWLEAAQSSVCCRAYCNLGN